ncbi:MAG: hypothetical protein LBM70_01220 [Victivallales bacterium]|jgi:predicted HicB family RNase H-like nuclease|nr:hypothetical protein [Victivallales bacterium]
MNTLKYKGFVGSVEYSDTDQCFFGSVLGQKRDGVAYEGNTLAELEKDFRGAVDDYVESCTQRGIVPENAYSTPSKPYRPAPSPHYLTGSAAYIVAES